MKANAVLVLCGALAGVLTGLVFQRPVEPRGPTDLAPYASQAVPSIASASSPAGTWALVNPILAGNAVEIPAATGGQSADAIAYWRALRARNGLPAFQVNANLSASAKAHSDYLSINGYDNGHAETPGAPGFTGASICARMAAAGYGGTCYNEVVSAGSSVRKAVEGLIDAPFHRFSMLTPVRFDTGVGAAPLTAFPGEQVVTIDSGFLADAASSALVLYPYAGQTSVPKSWFASEHPDPLPDAVGRTVGYPVTVQTSSGNALEISFITVRSSKGRVHGRSIRDLPQYRIPLGNEFVWIPMSPLDAKTTYIVDAIGALNGQAIVLSWSFTTGA